MDKGSDVTLYVTGAIDTSRILRTLPGILDFGNVAIGSSVVRMCYVRTSDGIAQQLPQHVKLDGYTPCRLVATSNTTMVELTNRTIEVELCLSPDVRPGPFESSLEICVTGPQSHSLEVPVRGTIVGSVLASPTRLYLAAFDGVKVPREILTLSSMSGRKIWVTGFTSDLPIVVKVINHESVSSIELEITAKAMILPATTTIGSLTLNLSDGLGSITIPTLLFRPGGN
jgi:hypothetical protein